MLLGKYNRVLLTTTQTARTGQLNANKQAFVDAKDSLAEPQRMLNRIILSRLLFIIPFENCRDKLFSLASSV
ncbi:MAG: hypothetical protein GY940_32235 [bacterium]|nr:hypothetical protein [bacterium]